MAIVLWNREYHSRGFGREAIRLIQQYVFDQLNLNRMMLHVHVDNERGINCYRKCGFMEEGRLRQVIYKQGQYFDALVMSILKEEFNRIE